MARIRTIKPDFWRDESLSSISSEAALLAIGLLNHADDEGYFNANPKLIESDVFPLRELSRSTTVLLKELFGIGYIRMFKGSDNKQYGQIVNFEKHQVINKKVPSKIKDLIDVPYDYGSDTVVLPSGMEWNGMEKEVEKEVEATNLKITKKKDFSNSINEIFEFWVLTMGKSKAAKLTKNRSELILSRIKEGYSIDQIKTAISGCAKSPFHMGQNPDSTVHDDITLICRSGDKLEWFIQKNSQVFNPLSKPKESIHDRRESTIDGLTGRNNSTQSSERIINAGTGFDLDFLD